METIEQHTLSIVLIAAGVAGLCVGFVAPRLHANELVFGALFVVLGLLTRR